MMERIREEVRQVAREGPHLWLAIGMVVALSAAMLPIRDRLGVLNVTLLFLLLAFVLGLCLGLRPSVAGAFLSFLSLDVLFLEPYYTLTVAAPDHMLALFVYLGGAIASCLLRAGITAA
jgi:two-component system sensor histidine kinase KdpD